MNSPAISWYYRLEVRQSVPILAGLAVFLVLLLSLGYFHARDQILMTARTRVDVIVSSIVRHESYVREWLERAMPPVAHLAATFPSLDEADRQAADARMVSMISDEWGHQIIEVGLLDGRGGVTFRRYDSKGPLAADAATDAWTADKVAAVKAPVWYRPEIGADRALTLRYTVPLTTGGGGDTVTVGVCNVRLTIGWFADRISSLNTFENETTFFLAPDGSWTLPSDGEGPPTNFKERLLANPASEVGVYWKGQSYVTIATPFADSGLLTGLLIPRQSLFGALDRLTRLLGGIGLAVLLLAAYGLHRTTSAVLRPLRPLSQLAVRLAHGNLEADLTAPTQRSRLRFPDEAERLGRSTEDLRQALHQRLLDLVLLGRTRERLFGEFNFARGMQEAQRPQKLPQSDGLEIAAYVHTAGEVCGDLYDYFLVAPRRLCCVMGSVAERGVPAALTSVRVVPLLHELIRSGLPLGKALKSINKVLTATTVGAPPMVSVFVGLLDLDDGTLRWACAGQMPPYRYANGEVEQLAWTGNVPLGIRPQEVYTEQQICLSPGDLLLFCSPRLLSVPNAAGQSFGDAALRDFLNDRSVLPPAGLLSALYARLRDHAGDTPSDDLTFFAVRWTTSASDRQAGQTASGPG
jgi:sigma-B regulation protein RsbU (phosphoserine phosphatase)